MPVLVARDPQQLKGGASLQAVYRQQRSTTRESN